MSSNLENLQAAYREEKDYDNSAWEESRESLPDGTIKITNRDFGEEPCPKCGKKPLLYWLHDRDDIDWIPDERSKIRMRSRFSKYARPLYGCHDCARYSPPVYFDQTPFEAAKAWNEMPHD